MGLTSPNRAGPPLLFRPHFPGGMDYPDKRLLTAHTSSKGSVLLWEAAGMGIPGWNGALGAP